jgi:hypothetical protein
VQSHEIPSEQTPPSCGGQMATERESDVKIGGNKRGSEIIF